MPNSDITDEATSVNRLTKKNGNLYYENKKVKTLTQQRGLKKFKSWTKKLKKNEDNKLILVAHNAHRFAKTCFYWYTYEIYFLEEQKPFSRKSSKSIYVDFKF